MQTLCGHKGSVVSCKVHRNYVLSSGYDKILRIWNAESGVLLHSLVGHEHIISSLDVSSSDDLDDALIVSGSWDRHLNVWRFPSKGGIVRQSSVANISSKSNAAESKSDFLLHSLTGHKNRIKCVKAVPFSNCESSPREVSREHFAVSGSDDGLILVWNISQGSIVHALKGHSHFILQLVVFQTSCDVFAEDSPSLSGCCLASYSSDRTIRLWNLSSGEHTSVLSLTDITSSLSDESDLAVSALTLAMVPESSLMQLPLYVTSRHQSSSADKAAAGSEGKVVPVLVLADSFNNLSLIDLHNNGRLLLHIACRPDSTLTPTAAAANGGANSRRIVSLTVAAMPNDSSGVVRLLYLTDRGDVGCVNLFEAGVKVAAIKHSLSNAVSLSGVLLASTNSSVKSTRSSKKSTAASASGGDSADGGNFNTFHQIAFGCFIASTVVSASSKPTAGYIAICGDEGTLRCHSYSSVMRTLDTAALVTTATTTKVTTPHSTCGSVDTADSFNTSIASVRLPLLMPAPPKNKIIKYNQPTTTVKPNRQTQYFTAQEDEVSLSEHSLVNAYDAQILYGGVDFEEISDSGSLNMPPEEQEQQNFWSSLVGNANYGFKRVKFNGGRRNNNTNKEFNAHPQSELNQKLKGGGRGAGSGLVGSGSVGTLRQGNNQPALFQQQQQQQQPQHNSNAHHSDHNNSKRQKKMTSGGGSVVSGRISDHHLPQLGQPPQQQQQQRAMQHSQSTNNANTAAAGVVHMNFESVGGAICYVDEYSLNNIGNNNNRHRKASGAGLNDDNVSVSSLSVSHHRGGGYNNAAYSHNHYNHGNNNGNNGRLHGGNGVGAAGVVAYKQYQQQPQQQQLNINGSSSHYGGTGRKASGGRVVLPMIKGVV